MSTESFIAWLYDSSLSTTIRGEFWIVPTVQSIHIVAIAVIFSAAIVSGLRLTGALATDEPLADVVRRYQPWMRNSLIVLLVTGLLMVLSEPDRVLANSTFWLKMVLIVGVFALNEFLRRPFLQPAAGAQAAPHRLAKPLTWLSIALWCVVIFCGRWIAYTI